jgi:hypothetical protein
MTVRLAGGGLGLGSLLTLALIGAAALAALSAKDFQRYMRLRSM